MIKFRLYCNLTIKFDHLAAQAAGIPLLDPSLDKDALFTRGRGENFAVAGSTALSAEVLAQKNISPPLTNSSLSVQLDWMLSHFSGICINANG
jgi:hypothetical protein